MNYQHKDFAGGKWFKLDFASQMANIGADVGRAIKWKNKVNCEFTEHAFYRALELLALTIADEKNRGAKLKELCRLKEVIADYFIGENVYKSNQELWEKYFYAFNYLARRK